LVTAKEVVSSDVGTTIRLSTGKKVILPPYRYVQAGDLLKVWRDEQDKPKRVVKYAFDRYERRWSRIPLHPPYVADEEIFIAPHKLKVTFFERNKAADWRGARLLEKFHYRGMGLNRIVGRRTLLMAKLENFGVVGYGVVSASVAAAQPRFNLLKTNLTELMRTKLINKLVRIPRIVIHPEFRGIGLGALMAKHLVKYVKQRWDVRGYRPVLVEVIAAMTEYHRFFESAEFIRLGQTGGYEGLAVKPQYGRGSFEQRKNVEKYRFMVNQKPKPYLVFPLTKQMQERISHMLGRSPCSSKELETKPLSLRRPIWFSRVSVAYTSHNDLSPRAEQIKEGFGVDVTQMYSAIIRNLSLVIRPGDAVLLTGASGSGKSTIIKLLTQPRRLLREEMRIQGSWFAPVHEIAFLSERYDASKLLIDQVGKNLHEAIALLNGIGLAEAHLYLKRPWQISEGQKYRFAVARLCNSRKAIWIADEFASTLDPITAAIVAKGLRKIAYRQGATLILAAPHTQHFRDSLIPNVLVTLRWGGVVNFICLRSDIKRDKNLWYIRIANAGQTDLMAVEVGGVNKLGQFHLLRRVGTLRAHQNTRVALKPATFSSYVALRIRTRNGVGDIFYLR